MRTPRSTEGSYSKVSVGVRFRRSSDASRAWSGPCAAASPASDSSRLRSDPSTLTYTVAVRRSGEVVTPVTVTKPMRGSLSSSTASASTARTDSLTRRMRSVIERHHVPLAAHEHELLAVEPARGLVEEPLDLALLARDDSRRQARALPQLVVVDLRDGRAEPVLELRLRRLHELALSLQRARL